MKRVKVLTLAAILVLPISSTQPSTKYQGRTLDLDGQGVEGLRLGFVGVADTTSGKHGAFEIEIEHLPVDIQLESRRYRVVSPSKGRLEATPSNGRIEIVLAPADNEVAFSALGANLARIADSLQKLDGTVRSTDAVVREALAGDGQPSSQELKQLLEALHRTTDDLAREVDLHRASAKLVEDIAPTIDAYLLELRNLRDRFELVFPYGANKKDRAAIETLRMTTETYSKAFDPLYKNRNAMLARVDELGPGVDVASLRRKLSDVLDKALDQIHKERVLQLNDSLVTLQRTFTPHPPTKEEVKTASDRVVQTAKDLRPMIDTLETQWREFRSDLEHS